MPSLIGILIWFLLAPLAHAEAPRVVVVPTLVVSMASQEAEGAVSYVAIQFEPQSDGHALSLTFNELSSPWSGSLVGESFKTGARHAVTAAARTLGADERRWRLVIKAYSPGRYSEGSSASSVVAVGIMAAVTGDTLVDHVGLTGVISLDGRIGPVGGLTHKLAAAAAAKMRVLLIPRGQAHTPEGDLQAAGQALGLSVIEVDRLADAYAYMTGREP